LCDRAAPVKPPLFEYHRAESTDEAVALLAEHADEAKVLAGGQSLVPLLSLRLARPAHLIDINRVGELAAIANGNGLTVGALVRHRAVERSDIARTASPLLAHAVGFIGHSAIRNRGTVGGSIAHADPAAELPAVLLVLDGEVQARSARGIRTVSASALFEGFLTTSLEPDELLTAVHVPEWTAGTGWSFQEFSRRSGDFAIVGVAATVRLDSNGNVGEARLAFSGVDQVPVRATAAESLMAGAAPSDDLWKSAAQAAATPLEPASDIHGSAAYRRQLAAVLAERALREAHDRAKDAR
ncbi:MAG: xanthine dehydrogenase family protein subunit M, partial [Acidimicrobiales bacterium]